MEYIGRTQVFGADTGSPLCDVCFPTPTESPVYVDRLLFHMPDGSSHELRKNDTVITSGILPTLAGVYYAVDGSRLKYDADTATLYLPDGSRYLLSTTGGAQFIDRNGNSLGYDSTNHQWTDTLGRTIGLPPLQNSSATDLTYSLPGFNGSTIQVTLRFKNLTDVLTYSSSPRYTGSSDCNYYPEHVLTPNLFGSSPMTNAVCGTVPFNPIVLWQVVLPNNSSYTLTYNVYGEIDKVVLPTGGYERFNYAAIDSISSSLIDSIPYGQANRGVTDHWISAKGDGTDEVHWQYTTTGTMTSVTGPNGAKSERVLHSDVPPGYGYSMYGFQDPRAGRAYEERTYNASAQMIRRTLVEWSYSGPLSGGDAQAGRDPRATKKVEILLDTGGNALAAMTTTSYDSDLNEVSSSRYDYVSVTSTAGQTGAIGSFTAGTLLRTEEATYLVNDAEFSSLQTAYRNHHLIALPTKQYVKNGSGTIVAATRFTYDEGGTYAPLTYTGTIPGWTDPSTTYRGNGTTTQRWLNFNGTSFATYNTSTPSSNTYVTTHAQPDQCGSVRKVWDANGNVAEMIYTDNFSGGSASGATYAYPTHTKTPKPDASGYYGSSSELESYTIYDYQTGKVTKTTDANNKDTIYSYLGTSQLNRLDTVSLPDGGQTNYEYGNTPGSIYVRTRTKQSGSDVCGATGVTCTDDYTYFDGLGRAWRSGHYEAASSWSVKDTEYDTLGRAKRVSNPYLATNLTGAINPSGVWTTPAYDDLNRTLTVTTPDGAVVTTAYSGNQVTVTDAANKKRSSVTDALGRLSQVTEDPAGTPLTTTYSYETLGNLTVVNQGGQYRYFSYDSLSRLVRAKNPEQDAYSSLNLTNPPAYNQ